MIVDLTVPVPLCQKELVAEASQRLKGCYALHWESLQQLIHLLVRHLLSELSQDVSQLASTDKAVPDLVKHLEPLDELVYVRSVKGTSLNASRDFTGCSRWFPAIRSVENLEELVKADCESVQLPYTPRTSNRSWPLTGRSDG